MYIYSTTDLQRVLEVEVPEAVLPRKGHGALIGLHQLHVPPAIVGVHIAQALDHLETRRREEETSSDWEHAKTIGVGEYLGLSVAGHFKTQALFSFS
jgi:hypothetical protein